MANSLNKIFQVLINPLLCYVIKPQGFVFRNFSFTKNTGYCFEKSISKSDAGLALEYKIHLDKVFKNSAIVTFIILYLIFSHHRVTLSSVIFFEILYIGILGFIRLYCSYVYNGYLMWHFGKYTLVDFEPPITKMKKREFTSLFYNKVIMCILVFVILYMPSVILPFMVKACLSDKVSKPSIAYGVSNIYATFYPKSQQLLDMQAYAKFLKRDYKGALDYTVKSIELGGRRLSDEDINRFGNLIFLQNIISGAHDAVDIFNEYATQKSMTTLQKEKMLWIKSAFKIKHSIYDGIMEDYDDLLAEINEKDIKNTFYVNSDRAFMNYMLGYYDKAIQQYDDLISEARDNSDLFNSELPRLYVERGWIYYDTGNADASRADFMASGLKQDDIDAMRPSFPSQNRLLKTF